MRRVRRGDATAAANGTFRGREATRQKGFALVALALGVAGISGTSEGCRTATQVELVVTYDGKCSDLQEVALIIGTDRGVAEASTPAPISRKRASRLASAGTARAATRSKARTA